MKDGGPAFPMEPGEIRYEFTKDRVVGGLFLGAKSGMSLRDYFAGQALIGLLASTGRQEPTFEQYAKCAYHHADAMLAAKSAGREP